MKSILQFRVFKGDKYFVAECVDAPIVTQGETLDELVGNIPQALALHMEDEELAAEFVPSPAILMSFELPLKAHV